MDTEESKKEAKAGEEAAKAEEKEKNFIHRWWVKIIHSNSLSIEEKLISLLDSLVYFSVFLIGIALFSSYVMFVLENLSGNLDSSKIIYLPFVKMIKLLHQNWIGMIFIIAIIFHRQIRELIPKISGIGPFQLASTKDSVIPAKKVRKGRIQ